MGSPVQIPKWLAMTLSIFPIIVCGFLVVIAKLAVESREELRAAKIEMRATTFQLVKLNTFFDTRLAEVRKREEASRVADSIKRVK